jgi:hypothetical protein
VFSRLSTNRHLLPEFSGCFLGVGEGMNVGFRPLNVPNPTFIPRQGPIS